MITFLKKEVYSENKRSYCPVENKDLVEIACLSTDDKPTDGIETGSMAIEVDTGDIYLFDEVSSDWNKMCSIKEE